MLLWQQYSITLILLIEPIVCPTFIYPPSTTPSLTTLWDRKHYDMGEMLKILRRDMNYFRNKLFLCEESEAYDEQKLNDTKEQIMTVQQSIDILEKQLDENRERWLKEHRAMEREARKRRRNETATTVKSVQD